MDANCQVHRLRPARVIWNNEKIKNVMGFLQSRTKYL